MSKRNIVGLALIVISLICLYPGLTLPILNISIGASIPLLGEIELYDRTQSVVSGIRLLYDFDNGFVATMILIFSVVVPVLKAVILFVVLAFRNWKYRINAYNFVAIIGKWSMADVFVVATFLAYLGTTSDEGINSEVMEGLYYFTAYCIISLLAIQVIKVDDIQQQGGKFIT
jgi:paraquat-inducible protein A